MAAAAERQSLEAVWQEDNVASSHTCAIQKSR